ncbi:MAG TPA: DoxX family protein [Archangium sp.]|uniref:DoxX family protein n=1 Tax=Archangium sp. TaxID=1872627 RepID=UPI002E36C835|nr:DoxX family protein [Archangium sp.]HEX5747295.1 DoxX family protein [Archangium sp.]
MNSPMRQTNPVAPSSSSSSRAGGSRQGWRPRLVRTLAEHPKRDYWLERVPETPGRYQVRGVTGVIFILFGLMKSFDFTLPILVGAPGLHVHTGVEGFAQLIAGLGIPFPLFNAAMVITMEIVLGLGLILGAWMPATRLITRLCALPLAVDMMMALLVGIRQVQGNPVVLGGFPIMNQFWRLPLELGLLAGMVYLLWRPAARAVAPRLVPVPAREG